MATDTVAEWSNLPADLKASIAEFLTTRIDLLRFRAVCTSWRSSTPPFNPKLPPSPLKVPILNFLNSSEQEPVRGTIIVSETTIYRLQFSDNNPNSSISEESSSSSKPWLVMVDHSESGKTRLLNPLTARSVMNSPTTSPKVLNLLEFSVLELGKNYIPQSYKFDDCGFNFLNICNHMLVHKVVFLPLNYPRNVSHNYTFMALFGKGRLGLLKSGDENWTSVDEQRSCYNDVINYKGQFYAVDGSGRAIVIDCSLLNVTETASAICDCGGEKKRLVESLGDLLLVESYLHERKRTVFKFRVYKLNEKEHKWVELISLGDRMLFLGDEYDCAFSASARDFEGCKGNCIYFTKKYFLANPQCGLYSHDTRVFNFEDGSLWPLDTCPEYSDIFRPPAMWLMPNTSSSGC